jgi:glyoxylase-like metal-dependent hydrolase (beta-lactamase superfamily II)
MCSAGPATLGDGTVRLISTPGHTIGHQSVLLALADGRTALVVGDAAYTLRSIREQRLPMLTADDAAARESLRQLNAFAAQHPEALLVPTHDPDAWRDLAGGE